MYAAVDISNENEGLELGLGLNGVDNAKLRFIKIKYCIIHIEICFFLQL